MLAPQGLQKALRDDKPTDITTIYWNKMKDKAPGLIILCVSDDMMNHILDLLTPKDV